jgi:hypothetical protein
VARRHLKHAAGLVLGVVACGGFVVPSGAGRGRPPPPRALLSQGAELRPRVSEARAAKLPELLSASLLRADVSPLPSPTKGGTST